jgi:hypothetical protein
MLLRLNSLRRNRRHNGSAVTIRNALRVRRLIPLGDEEPSGMSVTLRPGTKPVSRLKRGANIRRACGGTG